MAQLKLPFIAWRDGRPRFVPGPRERDLGYRGEDLRHGPQGEWYTRAEAIVWADARHAEILARRGAAPKKRPPLPRGRTVADLLEAWFKDLAQLLATNPAEASAGPRTVTNYRKQIKAICLTPAGALEDFARTPVGMVEKPEALAFIKYHMRVRGPYMGRASRAVLQAAFAWGETAPAWRLKANPFARLRLPKPAGRVVIYTDAEIRALIAAADRLGRASIGDAVLLGLFTGQRQADRLALEDRGLEHGRRRFCQEKSGAIVAVPETPALKARLAAARARVGRIALELGTRPATIVVDETTGRPFNEHTYRHVFAQVRAAAARELPALAQKRDQDLRDTAVTWLARAGCTIPEIAAITGHSLKSIHTILAHYLAITPELADSAIAKLVAWMEKEGMAV